MPYVISFSDIKAHHLAEVGGKGVNLGVLARAGFPVPPGFCVTTAAYEAFVGQSGTMARWLERLERMRPDDVAGLREAGEGIRAHLFGLPVPEAVAQAVAAAWTALGEDGACAVRSSATAEDLPGASFAGQQDTYLNVRGREALLDAVRRCWVSLFTDRAIAYRARNGFDHRSHRLAVVVQKMVFPEVSGVLFTADPLTGNRRMVSIDASYGLGEALVSGRVTADLYQVRGGEIVQRRIARKEVAAWWLPEGGTGLREVPEASVSTQALPDNRILELAELGRRIERYYGAPQDIEWCWAEGRFFVVQSRPITTLYPVPGEAAEGEGGIAGEAGEAGEAGGTGGGMASDGADGPDRGLRVYFSFGHQQMMTDAIPMLGRSALRTLVPFGKATVEAESTVVLSAGGRLFADPSDLLRMRPFRHALPRLLRNIDVRMARALEAVARRPDFQRPVPQSVKRAVRRVVRAALEMLLPRVFGWMGPSGRTASMGDNPTLTGGRDTPTRRLSPWRDPAAIRAFILNELDAQVREGERWLSQAAGAERIRRVRVYLGTRIIAIVRVIGPYLLIGVASYLLTQALVRRWFGQAGADTAARGYVSGGGDAHTSPGADEGNGKPGGAGEDDRLRGAVDPAIRVEAWLAALNRSLPGNVTSEMGLRIGDLADLARASAPLRTYLASAGEASFWEGLLEAPGGAAFAEALRAFLDEYGMRCAGEIDITRARWRETPAALVPAVLSQVRALSPGEHRFRFAEGEREAAEAAEQLLTQARRLPGGWWKARVLRRLITGYRGFAGLRETPKYTMVRHLDLCRRALLEEVRALVDSGRLDHEEDAFHLTLEELEQLAAGDFAGDVRPRVAARRRAHAHHKTLTPPRVITSEGEVVDGAEAGGDVPEGALLGSAVSAGVAEGRARVVLRPEAARLEPGDILVAPFTDPGWTPLFHAARALVMEVGGLMTHGAVVAREYGIPAVVGIDGATRRIPDGARIRVDGGRGVVEILGGPDAADAGAREG
ncbi:phosphoenolpyruvate synthase [Alicyclobacillus sp.]|uniref:phosphoenolpyruvate synthase n=1 Tax=Alicyclobacillus sp. TaxID=61169 RepID=UPI0025C46706|nr:phosphoenolpyruvate synthase [Alicyclobacillus sp.]MCL6516865.1 phosphoenolpyruvate synthase [Alicyclobacillus sp.]